MKKSFFVLAAFVLGLILITTVSYAGVGTLTEEEFLAETEITEDMPQGDFAKLLVKEVGAEGLLPAASTTNAIFKFWEDIGVIPPGGWDADANITKDNLVAILNLKPEEAEDLTFDDLLKMLKKKLLDVLKNKKGGPGPAVSPIAPVW